MLAFAGTAEAAGKGNGSQHSGALNGVLGQVAQQSSQTAQTAAANATAVQVQPVNIAVTIAVNSPGASPKIVQTNGNSAAANAANSSSTNQNAGQSQSSSGAGSAGGSGQGKAGGGGSDPSKGAEPSHQAGSKGTATAPGTGHGTSGGGQGGQIQLGQQSSQTSQTAGAKATAVQVQPINIAIPVAVKSPGASPVIVQTNGNWAAANASNSSSTNQGSKQSQADGTGSASQTGAPPANNAQPPPANQVIDFGGPITLPGLGPGWSLSFNWDSMSNWNLEIGIPGGQAPPMPDWQLPVPGWPSSGNDEVSHEPAGRSKDDVTTGSRSDDGRAPVGWTASESSSTIEVPPSVSSRFDSSSFVQGPANEQEPFIAQLIPVPRPALPAPPGSAAGPAVSGLILGALAILALHLAYLGLLLGRLGLASAPWRHQAYLAPLQRPG